MHPHDMLSPTRLHWATGLMPSYLQSHLPCYSFSFICLLHENGQDCPSFIPFCSYMFPFHGRDLPPLGWYDFDFEHCVCELNHGQTLLYGLVWTAWTQPAVVYSASDGIAAFGVLRPFLQQGSSRNRLNGRLHSPYVVPKPPSPPASQDLNYTWELVAWRKKKRGGSLISSTLQCSHLPSKMTVGKQCIYIFASTPLLFTFHPNMDARRKINK